MGAAMSGKDHNTRAHPKRHNKISEQWASYPIAMLESPAYRALSQGAHRVIARIAIELASHGGNDNGELPVTKEQFCEYGLHPAAVAPALREAEALGFIETTERGRGGNAEMRRPSLYRITFLNERGSRANPPTHEWQRIKTVEDAERIAAEARKAKSQNAVNNGRASWRKRQAKKYLPVPETGTEASTGNRYRNDEFPSTGNRYYGVGTETGTTSISPGLPLSREGRPSRSGVAKHRADIRLVWSAPDLPTYAPYDWAEDYAAVYCRPEGLVA